MDVGPLIDEEGLTKATQHVEDAVKRGARLLCGGKRIKRKGFFFEPTVLADVPAQGVCMCEETFAPVAAISPFDTEAEAIECANSSPYGLSAYAFTRDLGRTFRLMESLEAELSASTTACRLPRKPRLVALSKAAGDANSASKAWTPFWKPNISHWELLDRTRQT